MGLGENVRILREAKGLTYEAVGTAVGTDGQNIFNLEKRKSKVSKFAPALAEFFGVDLALLTSGEVSAKTLVSRKGATRSNAPASAAPPEGDRIQPDEMIELLTLYKQASPRGRSSILAFARSAVRNRIPRTGRTVEDKS